MGTQQSGALDLLIADLAKDTELLQEARESAQKILAEDPDLESKSNELIRAQVDSIRKSVVNWSRIS